LFIHYHILRISSVTIASGGLEIRAQVFEACKTIFTDAASGKDPRHAYAVTFFEPVCFRSMPFYASYYLVTGDYRVGSRRGAAFDFIQLGMAYTAA
jgi:hypothetical protein